MPLSALVVGSMAPDFVSFLPPLVVGTGAREALPFLPVLVARDFTHSWLGVCLFCIPAGLVMLWLFHACLKLPLLSLLPAAHRDRLAPAGASFHFGPPRRFCVIVTALALGAVTHVAWDLPTHDGEWAGRHAPVLYRNVIQTPHISLPLFSALQHASNVLGAALLLWWYRAWFKQAPAQATRLPLQIAPWARATLLVAMTVGTWSAVACHKYLHLPSGIENVEVFGFARSIAVSCTAASALEILFFSLAWHALVLVQNHRAAKQANGSIVSTKR
jgi:hypothetical protein